MHIDNWYRESKKRKKNKKKNLYPPSKKLDTQLFPNRKKMYHE